MRESRERGTTPAASRSADSLSHDIQYRGARTAGGGTCANYTFEIRVRAPTVLCRSVWRVVIVGFLEINSHTYACVLRIRAFFIDSRGSSVTKPVEVMWVKGYVNDSESVYKNIGGLSLELSLLIN